VVIVTRRTELQWLMAKHATRGQVEFYLGTRGQTIDSVEARHDLQMSALARLRALIPDSWSRVDVERASLDRFNFAPNDVVVAIGQDGLVANLAKYLTGQAVMGVSPDPESYEGVLTPLSVGQAGRLFHAVAQDSAAYEKRTMVSAHLDDGQKLLALNEIFIGHKTHQSARYILSHGETEEFQSSSGVIVATGTGFTGWAKSILTTTKRNIQCGPEDRVAHFFSREPWPSKQSGASLSHGQISTRNALSITSRMNEGGVIFADGIEQDFLRFDWGARASITLAKQTLSLVKA